ALRWLLCLSPRVLLRAFRSDVDHFVALKNNAFSFTSDTFLIIVYYHIFIFIDFFYYCSFYRGQENKSEKSGRRVGWRRNDAYHLGEDQGTRKNVFFIICPLCFRLVTCCLHLCMSCHGRSSL